MLSQRNTALPSARWIAVTAIIAIAMLAPRGSARAKDAPENSDRLPHVSIDGGYFVANGRRFIPRGAHWVPSKAAMQWPTQWDLAEIEADFTKMHELGYNMTRIDMLWAWFEPRPGDYNPEAFRQLDYLISLGHKYKIYIHPSLFIGGEVGEAYWDVPWRHGRNPLMPGDFTGVSSCSSRLSFRSILPTSLWRGSRLIAPSSSPILGIRCSLSFTSSPSCRLR